MKRFPCIYLFILFYCCAAGLEAAPTNQDAISLNESAIIEKAAAVEMKELAREAAENGQVQVIVELKESLDTKELAKFKQKQGGNQSNLIEFQQKELMKEAPISYKDSIKTYEYLPYIAMSVTEGELKKLRRSGRVRDIYKDRVYRPMANIFPNVGAIKINDQDVFFVLLSGYLEIDKAWFSGYSGKGQSIVVIDSGVDRDNPSLRGRVIREACISSRIDSIGILGGQDVTAICRGGKTSDFRRGAADVDCRVKDNDCSHGTYVALLAAGNNGAGDFIGGPIADDIKVAAGSGMAPEANIIAIKAESDFNIAQVCAPEPVPCRRFVTSDLAKALDYVLKLPRRLRLASVNMSLGGTPINCFRNPLRGAIRKLRKRNIATVVASGNDGNDYTISDPACIPEAIAVGATKVEYNEEDKVITRAISEFSNGARALDLLAPGEDLTVPYFNVDPLQEQQIDGTSFAAPLVAGAWASLKSHKPKASVDEILQALKSTGAPTLDARNATIKPEIRIDRAHDALAP